MAHTLTFANDITATVNGNTVTSPYTLHNGDTIVLTAYVSAGISYDWYVDNGPGSNTTMVGAGTGSTSTLDFSDVDINVAFSPSGSGR